MGGGVDRALAGAPSRPGSGPLPAVNPATGLSTDYLNHFTEVIMAIEMLTAAPDCLPDLLAWTPKTYCEHFAASRLSNRNAVIEAYRATDPRRRRELDRLSDALNAALSEVRDVVVAQPSAPGAAEHAKHMAYRLRPLVSRTASLINGSMTDVEQDRQAGIDELFR